MPLMVPSVTRRQVLGALGAAVGGSAVMGTAADQIPMDSIDTWEPSPGTWPCGRYDPGQTAANPHASPPADPEIVWRTATPGVDHDSGFVVGPERVYAAGVQVTALSRRDGTIQWQRHNGRVPHVIHDGTLYNGANPVLAFNAETGHLQWRSKKFHGAKDFTNYTVTAETVLAAGEAFDIHDGSHKWSIDHTRHVAQNGALYGYTVVGARVTKYRSRSVLDVTLGTGPTKVWERTHGSHWHPTVVQDNLLIEVEEPGGISTGRPGLAAFNTKSGKRVWTALAPADFESVVDFSIEEPDDYAVEVRYRGYAFTKNRGFLWIRIRDIGGKRLSAVVAVSLDDGSILWHRSLDPSVDFLNVNDIVVANGTVLLAHESAAGEEKSDTGEVQALDAATGREQWHVSTEYEPVQLAVADSTIFAVLGTASVQVYNRVIALR